MGKIRVSHKRVPFSFIDDALPKFKAYDAQRLRLMQMNNSRKMSLSSEGGVGINSMDIKSSSLKDHGVAEEDEDEAIEEEKEMEKLKNSTSQIGTDTKETEKASSPTPVQNENKENKSPKRMLLRGKSQLEISVTKEQE